MRMGTILSMPLPQMLQTMTTAMATSAIHQLAAQLLMAELESVMPMQMMIGPVTMGGKKRITRLAPKALNSTARSTYKRPAQATPMPA